LRKVSSTDDLTVEELRQLLIEKSRAERQSRLDQYRKTGRIIAVEPAPSTPELTSFHSEGIAEPVERHPLRRQQRQDG